MALDTSQFLSILQIHGYIFMFLLMFLEGPITTYVAAFAASLGAFNIYLVFLISALGNFSADLLYFFIGRKSKKTSLSRYIQNKISIKRIKKIKDYLKEHPWKTIAFIKLTPPLPKPGLILCGASGLKAKKFIFYSLLITFIYSMVLVLLGFYSGQAFLILSKYVKFIGFLIVAALILILIFWRLIQFFSKKISPIIAKEKI
jgi:membrane protein DedA with SNARE-associated domain